MAGQVSIEYGSYFQPPEAVLRATRTLACDGRMVLLAGPDGEALAAQHVGDPAAVPPQLLDLLPSEAPRCLWLAPKSFPAAHLSPAAWPHPPVYCPPCPLPPLGLRPMGPSASDGAIWTQTHPHSQYLRHGGSPPRGGKMAPQWLGPQGQQDQQQ
ncbi:hypothetical protein Vretifemale_5867, partial [Volvox reticuliferus]